MGVKFYNKEYQEIQPLEWSKKFEEKSYRICRKDVLSQEVIVSTAWTGASVDEDPQKDCLYDTSVFKKNDKGEYEVVFNERHSKTVNEAMAFHTDATSKANGEYCLDNFSLF